MHETCFPKENVKIFEYYCYILIILYRLAIERITSVDRNTEIKEYDSALIPESLDKTWIISGQSMDQRRIVEDVLDEKQALYVEGAFRVWIRDAQVSRESPFCEY